MTAALSQKLSHWLAYRSSRQSGLEDQGSGFLNGGQRFGPRRLVAGMKLDVFAARCVCVESDCRTDNEGDGLGLGFTNSMGCVLPPVTMMQQLVSHLVNENRKMFSGSKVR